MNTTALETTAATYSVATFFLLLHFDNVVIFFLYVDARILQPKKKLLDAIKKTFKLVFFISLLRLLTWGFIRFFWLQLQRFLHIFYLFPLFRHLWALPYATKTQSSTILSQILMCLYTYINWNLNLCVHCHVRSYRFTYLYIVTWLHINNFMRSLSADH